MTTASSDSFNRLPGPRQALPGPHLGKRLLGREAPGPAPDTRTRLRTGLARRGGYLPGRAAGEQLEEMVRPGQLAAGKVQQGGDEVEDSEENNVLELLNRERER
jgi:hypothetical protein